MKITVQRTLECHPLGSYGRERKVFTELSPYLRTLQPDDLAFFCVGERKKIQYTYDIISAYLFSPFAHTTVRKKQSGYARLDPQHVVLGD